MPEQAHVPEAVGLSPACPQRPRLGTRQALRAPGVESGPLLCSWRAYRVYAALQMRQLKNRTLGERVVGRRAVGMRASAAVNLVRGRPVFVLVSDSSCP